MPLTDEEREAAQAQILRELEEEHGRRLGVLSRKREQLRTKNEREQQMQRDLEVAELRDEMRTRFYEERGYKQYVDSRGRESWLTPEEHEWRSRHRRRRRRHRFVPKLAGPRARTIALYAGMLVLAVVLGILISR